VRRGDHVLYAGRLGREKGVFALLEAAHRSSEPWPLWLLGAGPAERASPRA
jgi:alpha-1,6-mannosyltransferase